MASQFGIGTTIGGNVVWHNGNFPLLNIKGISGGTLASRPTASNSNVLYICTDNGNKIYYDNGSWIIVGGSTDADTLDTLHATSFAQNFNLAASIDLNTIIASGMYRLNSTPVNGPTGGAIDYGQMLVIHGAADTITQIVFPYGSSNMYFRSGNPTNVGGAGSYGSWSKVLSIASTTGVDGTFDTAASVSGTATTRLNYNGKFYATQVYNAVYNDYAEYFLKDEPLEAGDLVITNPDGDGYIKSRYEYDNLIVGVFSDDYAHCIGGEGKDDDEEKYAPIGMAGRVRAKVIGPVKKGQLLVASDIPGVAMICKDYKPGTVIGKVLENNDCEDIKRVQMLILNM